MKLTRHNGRAGKNGVYNPKHNDRSFDIANSEHIDEERAKQNLYWDCYNGFRNFKNPEKDLFRKKKHLQRCLPIRKHRGAREKRYSFGYAVFLILALMK